MELFLLCNCRSSLLLQTNLNICSLSHCRMLQKNTVLLPTKILFVYHSDGWENETVWT